MAGIKELRLRIKALKNTSKITAAMKMVSAAKLKRAQDAYTRAKPYAERMEETLDRVLSALESPEHPLLEIRDVKRSEEHTSELQSRENLVCRLLLEKKKKQPTT